MSSSQPNKDEKFFKDDGIRNICITMKGRDLLLSKGTSSTQGVHQHTPYGCSVHQPWSPAEFLSRVSIKFVEKYTIPLTASLAF